MRSKGLFIVAFWIPLIAVIRGQTCTYTQTPNTKGESSDWFDFNFTADIPACEALCTANAACIAAEWKSAGSCYLYDVATMKSADSGTTFLTKQCTACSMSQTADTNGGASSLALQLATSDDCKTACMYLSLCEAVTFSGGTCTVYGGIVMTANPAESVDFVKQTCLNTGKKCCMESTSTLKPSGAALYTATSSLSSCEDVCLAHTNCAAVTFKNSVCYMHTTAVTNPSGDTGSTYSTKSCGGSPSSSGEITLTCASSAGRMQAGVLLALFPVTMTAAWFTDDQL